ncbi:MAG: hypothetical protein D6775_02375 [Caldilineae bacterium]|nr:MAG: hypothetical protein D6775_02375 [Caldilineae bacterium]
MILTVTPHGAIDRLLFVDVLTPGTTMRCERYLDCVGGKGFDTSVALSHLGVETLALGFVGGRRGHQLVALFDEYGVQHDLVWVEGELRLSHVIVESRQHRHSHIITGVLPVDEQAIDDLFARLEKHLPRAKWVIGGGSLPPGASTGFYRRLVASCRAAGVPVLLDIMGPPALATLDIPPDVLKMNRQEFARTFDLPTSSLEDLSEKAPALLQEYHLPALVLTLGREGILAFTEEGSWHARPPRLEAVNAAGAGDAASAAIAWRRSRRDDWPQTLRWAAAVSAAAVLTERTADLVYEEAEDLLSQVQLTPLT